MVLLSLLDASKAYGAERPLFDGVTFTVAEGERVGLIGPNGAGKSTLLRMLTGEESLDAGERVLKRGLRVGFLEQEPRFATGARVRDVVHEGLAGRAELVRELDGVHERLGSADLGDAEMGRLLARQESLGARLEVLGGHDVEHLVEATISGVGLPDPDAVCDLLSGGEARRVALAQLLVSGPDLLLLDEPTNHLDAFVVAWLEERIARLGVPLVLVTHDRWLLDRLVTRIVEVDRGKLYDYEGGYSRYVEQRAARLESEAREERSRLNLLRRETEWIRRSPLARTSKSKARIARYEDLVDAAPERLSADLELEFPRGPRLGAKVVTLTGVSHAYDGEVVLPKLDLELTGDMRLGVVGPNGAGKSTLVRILLGELAPTTGKVVTGETVRFSVMDQKRAELDPAKTVVEEVAGDADHVAVENRAVHVASFLERFLFPGQRKHVPVERLSGGERGRVMLAKLMIAGGNVLVLDEPTNDLDLATLRALEEALLAFPGAAVVVSHDRWFLDRVATHVLWLDGKGGVTLHTGDFSSLLAKNAEREASGPAKRKEAAKPPGRSDVAKPTADRPKRLSNWERDEYEKLTGRIEELEGRLTALDERLADPELYAGGGEAARELQDERETIDAELRTAMERWEELAERDV